MTAHRRRASPSTAASLHLLAGSSVTVAAAAEPVWDARRRLDGSDGACAGARCRGPRDARRAGRGGRRPAAGRAGPTVVRGQCSLGRRPNRRRPRELVGSQWGGIVGLLLGSVSAELVDNASCPVVVARHDRADLDCALLIDGSAPALFEVLVATWSSLRGPAGPGAERRGRDGTGPVRARARGISPGSRGPRCVLRRGARGARERSRAGGVERASSGWSFSPSR